MVQLDPSFKGRIGLRSTLHGTAGPDRSKKYLLLLDINNNCSPIIK